jgi:hypothetical protein
VFYIKKHLRPHKYLKKKTLSKIRKEKKKGFTNLFKDFQNIRCKCNDPARNFCSVSFMEVKPYKSIFFHGGCKFLQVIPPLLALLSLLLVWQKIRNLFQIFLRNCGGEEE